MLHEVLDARREVVVRIHQPAVRRDDAVPIRVRVVSGRDLEGITIRDERRHRIRRRAIHADLPVPVQTHETPRRIDRRIDHGEIDPMPLGDRSPEVDTCTTQWICSNTDACRPDGIDIDHVGQILDVGRHEVVPAACRFRFREFRPPDSDECRCQQRIRSGLHDAGDVRSCRAAFRRVVLETAIPRRIVRWSDDDAVGTAGVGGCASTVVREDRMRHRRCRRHAIVAVDEDFDAVRDEHLDGGAPGRLAQCMGVATDEQRTPNALRRAVLHDCLRCRCNVILIEGGIECGAAVTRRAEGNPLCHVRGIRML